MSVALRADAQLPAGTRVAILSDLHLGDGSPSDLFGDKDPLLLATLAREADAADAVVLNGDALDHVQGGAGARIEAAHPQVVAALRERSRRQPVYYVLGNHEDPARIGDTLPDVLCVAGVAVGEDLLITHGHQFDLHWGDGGTPSHRMLRIHSFLERTFRRPIRQPFRDYDNGLNRVVHRLFFYYTLSIRLRGLVWRRLGRPDALEHWQAVDNFWARGQWGDLSGIFERAAGYLRDDDTPWRTIVLGHSHQPGVVSMGDRTYVNAGTWALDLATVARVNEAGRVEVRCARHGDRFGDERYRMLLRDGELPDMAGWFRRYYRGFFRYDLAAIERDFPRA